MFEVDTIPNPSSDQLEAIDRQFDFLPVVNDSPEHLSAEQIESFNNQGYLMPFDGLSDEETYGLRAFFDVILAGAGNQGSYSISTAHLRFGRIYDLMSHPRILGPICDLLGPNVVAWGAHFFCKLPRDGKQLAWHQDAAYWPLTPTRTITVWLALDDATPENANMRFIPRSHLHGFIDYEQTDDEREVLNLAVRNPERYGDAPIDATLAAGEFSMHNDLLLHGSESNESVHRRCGLTMRYAPAEVRAFHDWRNKGIVVRGHDASGHWANHPRPVH
ncbi:MAG: phytanoyl-CoA dioxygenase family protein [Opitutales bacterium]|nr:phytanoyl-CoA dioxygenase family protein [Opitutales bacterium]